MIYIDKNLQSEVAQRYPEKAFGIEGHEWIERKWYVNRYFQIPTPIEDANLHYEVCPNSVELYFEGDDYEEKYLPLIEYLMAETENEPNIDWKGFGCGYSCVSTIPLNSNEQMLLILDDFIKLFDPLIETYNQRPSSSQPMESWR